jgi:hemerythrin-like domain-containing protein
MTAYVKRASVPPHLVDDGDPPAIAQLKEDHQILRALFDLLETVGEDVLFPIAAEICIRLAIHMNLEEEFLYPSLRPLLDADEIDEAILEHQLAKRLISDIMEMTGREGLLRATVHVLGEQVVRHIDEEDRELLRDARKAWEDGKIDLVGIGVRMQSRRRDLFTLVGWVAGDIRGCDVELTANAVERVPTPQSAVDAEPRLAHALPEGRR